MSTYDYLKSWNYELTARANRIRQLIGDSHWPTDGFYKEHIIRESLRRIIGGQFNVSHGFVKSIDGSVSSEIDVLLTSYAGTFSYFSEGDLQIVPPEMVVAMIEVKSKYTSNSLEKSLKAHLKSSNVFLNSDKNQLPWSSLLFYDCSKYHSDNKLLDSLAKKIRAALATYSSHPSSDKKIKQAIQQLPTCLAILNRSVMFLDSNSNDFSIKIRHFRTCDLSFAVAISDMFGAIRSRAMNAGEPLPLEQRLNLSSAFEYIDFKIEL